MTQDTPRKQAATRWRFPGIDGIKGLALLAIVVYHYNSLMLSGGFVGVDVFLTVSGFLITLSMLKRLYADGRIGWVDYCTHRLRRLYPALVVMVPAVTAAAAFIQTDLLVGIRKQATAALTFIYNWTTITSGASYFDTMNPQMLKHLWFIALLAQLYIAAPILTRLLWKTRHPAIAVLALTALSAASFIWMGHLYNPDDVTRVYEGTDTHAGGFLLGMALAWSICAYRNHTDTGRSHNTIVSTLIRGWRHIAAYTGFIAMLALIILAVRLKQDAFAFQGGIATASVLAVLLIAGTITGDSWMQGLFAMHPIASIGRYSYGIYLWHWPLWLLAGVQMRAWGMNRPLLVAAAALTITALTTAISHLIIEQPIARNGLSGFLPQAPFTTRGIIRCIASLTVVVMALAGGAFAWRNAPAKTSTQIALERMERMSAQHARMNGEIARRPVPKPKRAAHTFPTGDQMVAIGDSVMDMSTPEIENRFPGILVDAKTNRAITEAGPMISQFQAEGRMRPWLVLGLVTNSIVTADELDQIRAQVGPATVMVLVNGHGPDSWIPQSNDVIRAWAQAHPENTVYVDWDAAISRHLDLLYSDGVHPKEGAGGDIYPQAIQQAIRDWIAQGY
ncbi:acyltransferase [Bifidobacterium sp. 82T24]|uniref:acyltransferase family protein n=1 Tax=Bifidobacterium pluvialisilvae TaxID=2834436 RepID=UPI001C579E4B|nr:acyltransferase family protein [Bifidobacterium pluvialisilvae]MBW3088948.1 acyltransferase [Bifidobacterium pluvialisilvae]